MRLINYLNRMRDQGHKVILWTCRAGEALDLAVSWCRSYDLEFDAVNDNLPETIEKYGSNSRKITCDVYLDDRACYLEAIESAGDVDLNRIKEALIRFADNVVVPVG